MQQRRPIVVCGVDRTIEEVKAMCRDPGTDPTALGEIADNNDYCRVGDIDTLDALASNPGVPMESLLDLASSRPALVTQNAAFRLQLAMVPRFLESMPLYCQCAIAVSDDVEETLIRQLATERRRPVLVRSAAARNIACPLDLMHAFTRHAWRVRNALASNANLPMDLIIQLAADKKSTVRASVGRRKDLPDHLIQLLASDRHPMVQATIARRRDVDSELLGRMVTREAYPRVLVALIRNHTTPAAAISILKKHRNQMIQAAMLSYRIEILVGPSPR